MATVLKTVEQKCSVSSNLTLSANMPRYFSGRMSPLHGEGRQFESVTRYQYPIGEMNITQCYERWVGSLILSLGAKLGRWAGR